MAEADVAANAANLSLRSQLLDRRHKLEAARIQLPDTELVHLLQEVDRALERMDVGTYGICDVCHTPIEEERLLSNPLACTCLEHMSGPELRALERDLNLAVRVQTGLLPRRQVSAGEWDASYHYEPLGAVSGDFCDLGVVDGRLFFLVGDVAGKGVSASLLMSHLHAIFRSLLSVGMPVTELMERANRLFCESTRSPYYATLICGFAGQDGEVEVVNAGHCPAILLHDGNATLIGSTALPVGLFCAGHYPSRRIHLECGDALVAYTDGISEARNAAGEEYGTERIAEALRRCIGGATNHISACLEDLGTFLNGRPKSDDLTITALWRRSAASDRPV